MNTASLFIENKTFDEIKIGDSARLKRTLTSQDIELFAVMSGDVNPAHLDNEYAQHSRFHGVIAHGMWSGSLISTVLGTQLPGPGTVYCDQSLHFKKPVTVGTTITVSVTVTAKNTDNRQIAFDCECRDANGEALITGEALVIAPTVKIRLPRPLLPTVHLARHEHVYFENLLKKAERLAPLRTAVVHPVDSNSLLGAIEAGRKNLIVPILVGPEDKIRAVALAEGVDLSPYELIATEHSHAAAQTAVEMARSGKVAALMKGSLHTEELMHAVVDHTSGLRTARRISHVFVMDVPSYPRPLLITDAAINIQPDLEQKRDIVQNAIDLAHSLGISLPRVAILSVVETVMANIPSTLEAAALCKMAERQQITGGLLDGPLAFDNAVSEVAANTKGIVSEVAGRADVLVVPDLQSGNMLAKQLEYLAGADSAGLVLGARVPIILTSRSDTVPARLASCAVAALFANAQLTETEK